MATPLSLPARSSAFRMRKTVFALAAPASSPSLIPVWTSITPSSKRFCFPATTLRATSLALPNGWTLANCKTAILTPTPRISSQATCSSPRQPFSTSPPRPCSMASGLVHLVAPKAQILPLKAFSSNGTGYLSNIVAALYYAVQRHANVVNMSFDVTSNSPSLTQAVSYANKAGVVLVAAAGNESTSAPVYPAALNNSVVGIASTTNWDSRSSFSNYGSVDVLIAAPGENAISTYPGGTYASASGTSFSSPLVAGTAALMLSARPSLNQSQAASALSHAIHLTPDLNHGRLDIYQAVSAWVNSSGSSSGSGTCLLFCR